MTIKWKIALVEDDRRLARAVATGLGEEAGRAIGESDDDEGFGVASRLR